MLASEGCLRKCDIVISICNQCCAEGFASADATRGQWKQTNVCGRPLDPFAVASHVTWFLSLQGRQKGKQWFFTESWGKSSLGARLRTRKVRGRDASLPAPLLTASLGLVGRGTVGAVPQTPQGPLSLDPFVAPRLERASHAVPCRGFLPFSPLPYWNKDIISCGDSPPTMDSPGLISWSNSAFFRCPSATTCSSIEACVTRRITSTLRVCPMRYARSVA